MSSAESAPHHGTRTKARKRAVDILFESDLRERTITETLAERTLDADPPVREYTTSLVRGVIALLPEIDEMLGQVMTDGWSVARMPRVDRAIARMATWEVVYGEVDNSVAISEAMILARELSTDDSPAFLNGVLSAIAKQH